MESLGKGQRMVGEKLMKLRKKRGMSQQEVASALGVTRQTVSNWECDQGAPSLDKAADLARLCGVSLDDLVADEVEVVVADPDQAAGKPRDLHVLSRLEGKQCRICYRYTHDEIDIFKAVSMPEARARCQRWLAARRTRAGRRCALVEEGNRSAPYRHRYHRQRTGLAERG